MEILLVYNRLFIVFLMMISHFAVANENSPIVKTKQGELEGIYMKSRDGNNYSAFMAIPYGNKPEKFELAEPASSWEGVRDASKFGPFCSQFNLMEQKYLLEEDCLLINVFTPNVKGNLTVVAFVHGGGFFFGSSNENGADYFMDKGLNVVLVTFNYRLGSLGFLSTQDDVIPGNLGLKDQRLALEWIQNSIADFGGNKEKVLLIGESAGAASVVFHILSPKSANLFSSAAALSGTSLNSWAFIEPDSAKKFAFELGKKLNCPSLNNSVELKKCLKSKSVEEIMKNSLISIQPANIVVYGPTIEPPSSHAMITDHPEILYESGNFNKVPLILTACEKEGLLINAGVIMKDEKLIHEINENWANLAPSYFLYDKSTTSQEAKDVISKRIKKFYFGEKKISQDTFENLTNLYSDSFFIYEIRNTALFHAKHAPVYPIILAYDGYPWSQLLRMGYEKPLGMTHADDLIYLFSNERYPKFEKNSEAEQVSKELIKSLAIFGRGNPTEFKQQLKGMEPVSKAEIKSRNLKWLLVKATPKIVEEPIGERMRFWDKISKKLKAQSKKDEL